MLEITGNTRICDLENEPGFHRFARFLMECRQTTWEKFRQMPLSRPEKQESSSQRVIKGLRRVQQVMADGVKVDYDFWEEEEIAEQGDRAGTKLFYLPGSPGKPFVLICPGGGYQSVCTFLEGFPAAAELNEAGYHAFVLSYRVRQEKLMPKPIEDMKKALQFILEHSEQFQISGSYAMMGFSAGAHLAAELGTINKGWKNLGLQKPSAMILCYGAMDLRTLNENEIARRFCETIADTKEELEEYCINLHMDKNFPPTYLWQCEDDDTVPFENYQIMSKCLEKLGIPWEGKVYAQGGHGLQKPHDPEADCWIKPVINFLNQHVQGG